MHFLLIKHLLLNFAILILLLSQIPITTSFLFSPLLSTFHQPTKQYQTLSLSSKSSTLSPRITIRHPSKSDLSTIATLLSLSFQKSKPTNSHDFLLVDLEERFREIEVAFNPSKPTSANRIQFLAAESGSEIVGWVEVSRFPSISEAFQITNLCVLNANRRCGIGRMLIERCESYGKELMKGGESVFELKVDKKIDEGAFSFYLACGFSESVGVKDYDDNVTLMAKRNRSTRSTDVMRRLLRFVKMTLKKLSVRR